MKLIIEIGICTLDIATRKRIDQDSILFKPERLDISQFCTQLITLATEQLKTGIAILNDL